MSALNRNPVLSCCWQGKSYVRKCLVCNRRRRMHDTDQRLDLERTPFAWKVQVSLSYLPRDILGSGDIQHRDAGSQLPQPSRRRAKQSEGEEEGEAELSAGCFRQISARLVRSLAAEARRRRRLSLSRHHGGNGGHTGHGLLRGRALARDRRSRQPPCAALPLGSFAGAFGAAQLGSARTAFRVLGSCSSRRSRSRAVSAGDLPLGVPGPMYSCHFMSFHVISCHDKWHCMLPKTLPLDAVDARDLGRAKDMRLCQRHAASPNLASHDGREGPGGTSNLTRGIEFVIATPDESVVSENVWTCDLRPPS